jgi:glycerol-3-phosphate acyltransferase PlsY
MLVGRAGRRGSNVIDEGTVSDGSRDGPVTRTAIWVFVAYWVGTIPSPWVIARLAGRTDLIAEMKREESPGDAHFILSKKMSGGAGGFAIVLDMLKGFGIALAARVTNQSPATMAWAGSAAVAGHCFAPFLRRVGGRGLTTAAGVSLVLIPKAMIVTGVIGLAGTIAKRGGIGTSIGFGLLPVFAVSFGYPGALVWMALVIVGLIAFRRLEGISEDRRDGVAVGRAVLGRLLFDLPRGRRS